jgi:hypothetical protein
VNDAEIEALHAEAHRAFGRADLVGAFDQFEQLLAVVADDDPERAGYHYMAGLASKYLGWWQASLAHNLRSVASRGAVDEASVWNAGIAATALGDWVEARRLWSRVGIVLPGGVGPIEGHFGVCSVRLNPSRHSETVFAERIDVVRARIDNVPLPASGFGFGDVVLQDGASTGRRSYRGKNVPVFNALQRLQRSAYSTQAAFVTTPSAEDVEALVSIEHPGIGLIEDWTASIVTMCLRCSYGLPHEHPPAPQAASVKAWEPMRSVGIAAIDAGAAEAALDRWQRGGAGRVVDGLEIATHEVAGHRYDRCWWESPEEEGREQ